MARHRERPRARVEVVRGQRQGSADLAHRGADLRLAPQAALLSPRGKVLEHGVMPRFFARRSVRELDLDDLEVRTDELAEFVRLASSAYELDPARVVAVGYSNGANIAVSLLLRRPGLLRAAVLLRPLLPFEPDAPPALTGTDVFVAAGARDPYVPVDRSERLVQVLRSGGADVTASVADGGHELDDEELAAAERWLGALLVDGGR